MEDPKDTASQQVRKFVFEIKNLNQDKTLYTTRVTELSQELLDIHSRQKSLNERKEAELREIKERYEKQQTHLLDQETEVETKRNAAEEVLRENSLAVAMKEEELRQWENLVDYYGKRDVVAPIPAVENKQDTNLLAEALLEMGGKPQGDLKKTDGRRRAGKFLVIIPSYYRSDK
jgi:hypothetical protein